MGKDRDDQLADIVTPMTAVEDMVKELNGCC
jgi:hypothetical protein